MKTSDLLLAIDIGNTQTVIGVFKSTKLLHTYRLPTATPQINSKFWRRLIMSGINGAVISSVVPDLTNFFTQRIKKILKLTPLIISGDLPLGIKICYDDPYKLGADRLCNAIAGFEKYGGPAVIIDFGTATTYDVISKNGDYLGGIIAPGLGISAEALHNYTVQLPKIELHFPKKIIGTNTITSMQSGVMYGAIDAFEGMLNRISKVIRKKAIVIGTGGFVHLISQKTKMIHYIEPNLVLEGARIIYERIKNLRIGASE